MEKIVEVRTKEFLYGHLERLTRLARGLENCSCSNARALTGAMIGIAKILLSVGEADTREKTKKILYDQLDRYFMLST